MDQYRVAKMAGEVVQLDYVEDRLAMADEAQGLVPRCRLAFRRNHQLYARTVDLADLGQIDFHFLVCDYGVEKALPQSGCREDTQLALDADAGYCGFLPHGVLLTA